MESSFEPGRRVANEVDFQLQLDDWFANRANSRIHETLPNDRPIGSWPSASGWPLCPNEPPTQTGGW